MPKKLVEDTSEIFRIEKPSSSIIFQDFRALNYKQMILVLLIGKSQPLIIFNENTPLTFC